MGLLQKTLMLSEKKALTLFEFTQQYHITYSAILKKYSNTYIITDCTGFDVLTILTSISSTDFWNGTIQENNKLYNFLSEAEIRPFLQIFSDEMQTKLKNLQILKNNDYIYIFSYKDNVQNIDNIKFLNEINKIEKNRSVEDIKFSKNEDEYIQLFKISYENNIKEFISKHYTKTDFINEITQSINKRIYNQLKLQLSEKDNIVKNANNNFLISMKTKSLMPEVLIQKHLFTSLYQLIYDNNSNIIIENCGTVNSLEELNNFLKGF